MVLEMANIFRQKISKRYVILGTQLTEGQTASQRKVTGAWLLGCAAMVYGAVAIGGATRLVDPPLYGHSFYVLGENFAFENSEKAKHR